MKLLSVRNLSVEFKTDRGNIKAVDEINFDINKGETLCIVGESGSGKSVTVESIAKLIKSPPGNIQGEIIFDGKNILEISDEELKNIRGNKIGYIFQNVEEALNPVFSVGWQIVEAIKIHLDLSDKEAKKRAIDLLDKVGIPEPASRFNNYPHELSGGMKQRAMIAMALAPNPDLLIADEPTTALDVTIQAQILSLINDIQEDFDMSILFVTHDLGVVAQVADRVLVMYAGKIMEKGSLYDIFNDPWHPYTMALIECLPSIGSNKSGISGNHPSPYNYPNGCRFHPRCTFAIEECKKGDQPAFFQSGDRHVSCVHYGEKKDPSKVLEDMR